jgi:hypothetical protein
MKKLFMKLKSRPVRAQVTLDTAEASNAANIDRHYTVPDATHRSYATNPDPFPDAGKLIGTVQRCIMAAPTIASESGKVGSPNQPKSSDGVAFQYTPLLPGEVRFLSLCAGTSNQIIRCELFSCPLGASKSYEALSYMWGPREPPDQSQVILVNDAPVPVRKNLYLALQAIRKPSQPRLLWIDALCINQEDISERNSQVVLMTFIYHYAAQVVVWLGPEVTELERTMKFCYESYHGSKLSHHAMSQNQIDDIVSFLELPYWRRVWIIQEIICSQNLEFFYGSKRIPLPCFERLLTIEMPRDMPVQKQWLKATPAMTILRARHRLSSTREDPLKDLIELFRLCDTCRSECEDIRDRIYSLTGLIHGLAHGHSGPEPEVESKSSFFLHPDYSRTPIQVYVDIFILFFTGKRATKSYWPEDEAQPLTNFLSDSLSTIQRLLKHPTWNTESSTYYPLGDMLLKSQIQTLLDLEIPLKFNSIGLITKIGGQVYSPKYKIPTEVLNPGEIFSEYKDSIYKDDIFPQELHITQSLEVDNSISSEGKGLPKQYARALSSQSSGEVRLFTTTYGSLGFASRDIQPGDLVCQFNDDSFKPMFIALRTDAFASHPRWTIVGRAFLWYTDETAYERIHTFRPPMAENIEGKSGMAMDYIFIVADILLVLAGLNMPPEHYHVFPGRIDTLALLFLTRNHEQTWGP